MDPRSEVLLRHPERFGGALLLAGLPADDLLGTLPAASGWSWHAGEAEQLVRRYPGRVSLGIEPPAGDFASAVLFLPKSREATDFLLTALTRCLPAEGSLFLVGEKKAGIERAARQLGAFGKASKLDSARHCQLWVVHGPRTSADPQPDAWLQRQPLDRAGVNLEILSLPGVFSHGRLDVGTALLLDQLDGLPEGAVLDFGCGAGVVGAALARRYASSTLHLLDVDAFAVASSRQTLAANGLSGTVISGDGIAAAPTGLAAIVSNPPFHSGVKTDYRTTETLLAEAVRHLKPGGELRLVANSFLRYPPLIEAAFGNCRTLAERDGFKVYSARRR
ncbi:MULTISPECIES: methyltransferase [Pseudomonas]|uniref:Ribosomal RNA small subunit methyltransferase C n=1 Tax=Pseudomonas oryzihabitans TaxID=47885 RepID=A0A2Z5A3G3_9PSED|nr:MULTISPECIES: methyltransferase [Pseudomonas]AXA65325.1 16S rRNA methyltransferase [Pseudomonas oryzihabitans]